MRAPSSAVRAALQAALVTIVFGAAAGLGAGSSAQDIRDIRGPKWILSDWVIPGLIAAGALLAFAVFGGWRWSRRRRRPRAWLPFELALQRLEESRTLMQPATAKDFSIAVSDIVRSYIEQQFRVTATLRTTEEFLRELLDSSNAALASHRELLSEFLHQCDLAKFAGLSLTMQSMESLYQSACAFVGATGRSPSNESHDSLPAA